MDGKCDHLQDIQHIPGMAYFTYISEFCSQLQPYQQDRCYLSNLLRNSSCAMKADTRCTYLILKLWHLEQVTTTQPSNQRADSVVSALQNGCVQPVLLTRRQSVPVLPHLFPAPTCNRTCWSNLSLRASSSCFRRASTSSIFLAVAFFLAFSARRSSLAYRIHSHVLSGAAPHSACTVGPRVL